MTGIDMQGNTIFPCIHHHAPYLDHSLKSYNLCQNCNKISEKPLRKSACVMIRFVGKLN